jgi:hypothetical protein
VYLKKINKVSDRGSVIDEIMDDNDNYMGESISRMEKHTPTTTINSKKVVHFMEDPS